MDQQLLQALPPSLRERVVALVQGGAQEDIVGASGNSQTSGEVDVEGVIGGALLAGAGVHVVPEWLPRDRLLSAHMQAATMLQAHGREARMGSTGMPAQGLAGAGSSKWENAQVRGDRVMWLPLDGGADDEKQKEALVGQLLRVVEAMSAMRRSLLSAGLNVGGRMSCQLAAYPGGGARYVRHSDRSAAAPLRRLTAIAYLNPEWDAQVDGGQLAIYREQAKTQGGVDDAKIVAPLGGLLVVFDSGLPHEVFPSFAARYALTTWFSCDPALGDHGLLLPRAEAAFAGGDDTPAALQGVPAYLTCSGACLCRGSTGVGGSHPRPGIFVSIVSFCDPETAYTVINLFERAERPDRIRVGIVWQAKAEDVSVHMQPLEGTRWRRYVREIRLDWREATGPCRARHLAASLWAGEAHALQIDSHMRFAAGWDAALLDNLQQAEEIAGHHKVVLSTYPPGYEGQGAAACVPPDVRPTLLCASHFGPKDGMLRIRARRLAQLGDSNTPLPSLFWAAGFSFSRSELLKDVPYDPHLPLLFFGEEMAQLARMWTRGWEVFAPPRTVVFHLWSRSQRKTFSAEIPQEPATKQASQQAVRQLLTGYGPPLGDAGYGLGGKRGWAEFCAQCGVDFMAQEIEPWALLGGLQMAESNFEQ